MSSRREVILQGPLTAVLLQLAWPLLVVGQLFSVMALASSMWVGRLVGAKGLAILTVMSPVELILGWSLMAIASGHETLVGRSIGAGDRRGMTIVYNSIVLQLAVWGPIAVIGLLLRDPLAHLLAQGATVTVASRYLIALFVAMPFQAVGQILLTTAIAAGWTKLGVYRVLGDLAFTVAITPLLITFLQLSAAGVPTATLVGAVILLGLMFPVLMRHRAELGLGELGAAPRIDVKLWRATIGIGGPIQLGRIAVLVALMIFAQIVMTAGEVEAAAFGLAISIGLIPTQVSQALAEAGSIIVAQCHGANRPERAIAAFRRTLVMCAGVGAAGVLLVPFARPLVDVITDDPAVAEATIATMRVTQLGWMCAAVTLVFLNSYRATGATKLAGTVMICSQATAVTVALVLEGSPAFRASVGFCVGHLLNAVMLGSLYRHAFRRPLERSASTPP
jgi:Na+-driven multidrug efflux pump